MPFSSVSPSSQSGWSPRGGPGVSLHLHNWVSRHLGLTLTGPNLLSRPAALWLAGFVRNQHCPGPSLSTSGLFGAMQVNHTPQGDCGHLPYEVVFTPWGNQHRAPSGAKVGLGPCMIPAGFCSGMWVWLSLPGPEGTVSVSAGWSHCWRLSPMTKCRAGRGSARPAAPREGPSGQGRGGSRGCSHRVCAWGPFPLP